MAARPSTPSATAMKDQPTLRSAQLRASRGETLPWSQWARLTKLGCAPTKDGQPYQAALADVIAAAGRLISHPRLRADVERFIRTIFVSAAGALAAYQDRKGKRLNSRH